ncbi:prenyltransferase/squalene oxidase repeat-containing protein [Aeoliella mucimassa]|uniref:Squalene--hopene cyclase n=1 Tax=Aeoliella mucimassa TaxID=2527972 RepID=A0A518AP73_9BACT|nr:prenyltransferase/squalene oxidase repeat-containing protein [Aeoliella mucimassa]QDU56529.1 Squalene--hopene cyclase [Aeoliella mucimassa]
MIDFSFLEQLRLTLKNARDTLLNERNREGHWEGELASSALSTATAVCALSRLLKAPNADSTCDVDVATQQVSAGREWLATYQNTDGGWGDTTNSLSNISTSVLCWCAFAGVESQYSDTVQAAERYITEKSGSLETADLVRTVKERYGKDHTFSVPILTTMTLHGRLGDARRAWRRIPSLPFELSAFPREWFAALRLPVVSYALPALIAIGLVHHHQSPTRNPLTRCVRNVVRRRALKVLESIQPPGGGFLEATPLTSFVLLGLLNSDEYSSPVVAQGAGFLLRSFREDGSWPIDTNLATWVSTLSVNALVNDSDDAKVLSDNSSSHLTDWLLDQQYSERHPYTYAAPGGWAWTDLPGGVPDADDTPGALLALKNLKASDSTLDAVVQAGVQWLLDLQNSDGGIPTFCRGWGTLPFDRSSCDITAHGMRAWNTWRSELPKSMQPKVDKALTQAMSFLVARQRADGAWPPLWFGNQLAVNEDETNLTYGTSRVVLALAELEKQGTRLQQQSSCMKRGTDWLLTAQNADGGWGGVEAVPSSIEETAYALEALTAVAMIQAIPNIEQVIRCGAKWLIEHTNQGTNFPATPVGFYFAKLWYHERLYPMIYTVAALGGTHAYLSAETPATVMEPTS